MNVVALGIWLRGPQTFCFVQAEIEPNAIIHRDDPARRDILMLVARPLIVANDLEVSSFDLVDRSDVGAVAVDDRHARDHEIEQRRSFRAIIRMLSHWCPPVARRRPVRKMPRSQSHWKAAPCGNRWCPRDLNQGATPEGASRTWEAVLRLRQASERSRLA